MRDINYLVVHCSGTAEGKDFTADDIRDWHVRGNGWSDIGYHYVILQNGTIEKGRPVEKIGAHVKGHNKDSIGICYVGGVDANGNPKDTRTPEQIQSLETVLITLKNIWPKAKILGHRDFAGVAKACPSFDAILEYKEL